MAKKMSPSAVSERVTVLGRRRAQRWIAAAVVAVVGMAGCAPATGESTGAVRHATEFPADTVFVVIAHPGNTDDLSDADAHGAALGINAHGQVTAVTVDAMANGEATTAAGGIVVVGRRGATVVGVGGTPTRAWPRTGIHSLMSTLVTLPNGTVLGIANDGANPTGYASPIVAMTASGVTREVPFPGWVHTAGRCADTLYVSTDRGDGPGTAELWAITASAAGQVSRHLVARALPAARGLHSVSQTLVCVGGATVQMMADDAGDRSSLLRIDAHGHPTVVPVSGPAAGSDITAVNQVAVGVSGTRIVFLGSGGDIVSVDSISGRSRVIARIPDPTWQASPLVHFDGPTMTIMARGSTSEVRAIYRVNVDTGATSAAVTVPDLHVFLAEHGLTENAFLAL